MSTNTDAGKPMGIAKIDNAHPLDCKCVSCGSLTGRAFAELTLRVICRKCHKVTDLSDRLGERVQWSPSVYCGHCKAFIEIIEVNVGRIGRYPSPAAPAGETVADASAEEIEKIERWLTDFILGEVVDCVRACRHVDRLAALAREALAQRAELATLREQDAAMRKALPRTADGVTVFPGMKVWYVREGREPERHVISGYHYESPKIIAPDGYHDGAVYFSPRGFTSIWRWDQAYSTFEAAAVALATHAKREKSE